MTKEVTNLNSSAPATEKIQTGALLDQLMMLVRSNMAGDGQFTDKQINNQAKLTSVAIRVVELELKLNKAMTPAAFERRAG